jgi:hypothetical protein
MTETHVVSALRAKRAEISGHIYELEKKIGRLRASLIHVDESLRLFSPGADPDAIPPKRPYRRTRYFAARELSRRCVDTLREANPTLMTTAQIAVIIMLAKGYPADDDALKAVVIEMVVTVLRRLCKDGSVIKSGTTQDAQWTLAPSLL